MRTGEASTLGMAERRACALAAGSARRGATESTYAEAQLIPMLGDETHLVQTLGHTVLLYAPHPSAPRLAAELGLGARQAGEPSDGDAP